MGREGRENSSEKYIGDGLPVLLANQGLSKWVEYKSIFKWWLCSLFLLVWTNNCPFTCTVLINGNPGTRTSLCVTRSICPPSPPSLTRSWRRSGFPPSGRGRSFSCWQGRPRKNLGQRKISSHKYNWVAFQVSALGCLVAAASQVHAVPFVKNLEFVVRPRTCVPNPSIVVIGRCLWRSLQPFQFYMTWNLFSQVLTSSRCRGNQINQLSSQEPFDLNSEEHWIWLIPTDHFDLC